MIAWAKSAVRSPGYFFEKAQPCAVRKEKWDERAFDSFLVEMRERELQEIFENCADLDWEEDEEPAPESFAGQLKIWTEENVQQLKYDLMDGFPQRQLYEFLDRHYEDPSEWLQMCHDYDTNAWWCLEATKCFLRLYLPTVS